MSFASLFLFSIETFSKIPSETTQKELDTSVQIGVLNFVNESNYKGKEDPSQKIPILLGKFLSSEIEYISIVHYDSLQDILEKKKLSSSNIRLDDEEKIEAICQTLPVDIVFFGNLKAFNLTRFSVGNPMLGGYGSYKAIIEMRVKLVRSLDNRILLDTLIENTEGEKDVDITLLGKPTNLMKEFMAFEKLEFESDEFKETMIGKATLNAFKKLEEQLEKGLSMKKVLLLGLSLVFLYSLNCTKEAEDVVARVGDEVISLKEFEQDFGKEKLIDQLTSTSLETRESHLQNMIQKKLIVLAAYEQGLDQDEVIQERVAKEQERQLYLAAIQADIYDKLVPEEDAKEYYRHMNEKRRVSRIFLRFEHLNSPKEEERVKQEAQQLVHRIRKGEDFAELAKKYSQDQKTASKGGDIGDIKWGTNNLGKNLSKVIFNLQLGEVSEPIKTQIGYHIFTITEKKIHHKSDYEEARFLIEINNGQKY